MSQIAVIRLIHSLSKSEKRQFKLFTRKQKGGKDYIDLFDLIDQNRITDKTVLDEKFKKLNPRASLDNTARYLLKILLDCLIWSRIKEGSAYQLLYGLLRVNILNERNLQEEAYRELNKLNDIAENSQDRLTQYIIYREKLNYLSHVNFRGMDEHKLVEEQMNARDLLKNIRNTHEHYSLYELLKFRLTHSNKIQSEEGKKKLYDLLLSEMSIISGRVKNDLESKKLHLLFQSYFFTHVGEYQSALKTFYELNRLFEKDSRFLDHPPFTYFSALDGILDSLRTNGYFNEMDFYLQKLSGLDRVENPEYFCFLVRKTLLIYQLAILMGKKAYGEAINFINKTQPALWKEYSLVDEKKENELLFYLGLAWFRKKEFKKAQKFINEIILVKNINYRSFVYKAARLLSILISYENKDLKYLEYEIRSYKRTNQAKQKLLKTEKLVFKVIKLNPDFNQVRKNELLWIKLVPALKSIDNDKYEMQLLKYFDFVEWVENKFGKKDS